MDRRSIVPLVIFFLVPALLLVQQVIEPGTRSAPPIYEVFLIFSGASALIICYVLGYRCGRKRALAGAIAVGTVTSREPPGSDESYVKLWIVRSTSGNWAVQPNLEMPGEFHYLDLSRRRVLVLHTRGDYQDGKTWFTHCSWRWREPFDAEEISIADRHEIIRRVRWAFQFLGFHQFDFSMLERAADGPDGAAATEDLLAPRMFRPLAIQSENGWAVYRDFHNPTQFVYHDLQEQRTMALPFRYWGGQGEPPSYAFGPAAWRWNAPHDAEEVPAAERGMIAMRTREALNSMGLRCDVTELERSGGVGAHR